jgi:hypothetical protein
MSHQLTSREGATGSCLSAEHAAETSAEKITGTVSKNMAFSRRHYVAVCGFLWVLVPAPPTPSVLLLPYSMLVRRGDCHQNLFSSVDELGFFL